MKKNICLFGLILFLTACKPTSPQRKYLFDCSVDGVKVTNESENCRLAIELIDKPYFTYYYLNVGGYNATASNGDISFSDSEGEVVSFETSAKYNFLNVVHERYIYINYSDEMSVKINNPNYYIQLSIYNRVYYRPQP